PRARRPPCRRGPARRPPGACAAGSPRSTRGRPSREPFEAREVGPALLEVRVAALLRLLAHVIEERRVPGELLEAGEAVGVRVERRLEAAERERAVLEHAPAPGDGLVLEPLERHHLVDEAHRERRLRVVLLAEVPDLARLLVADDARQVRGAEAAVEAP